jgi:hypothetical protein
MINRSKIAALVLAVVLAAGGASAQDTNDQSSHHPAGAADAGQSAQSPAAMPMAGDDQGARGDMQGMPGMMGNMMQMMGRMMQMMPQMCGGMGQGGTVGAPMGGMGRGEMGGGMMGQSMVGRGMGEWTEHGPLRHIEGYLAFYRAELAITDAQSGPWNTFADAVRTAAKRLAQAHQAPSDGAGSALDHMQRRIALLSAHVETLKQVQAAAAPLYAVLSPEQRKTADALMSDHMGRM